MSNSSHEDYMRLALDLAEKARGCTAPNPMVGCVIVKNNQIIATGYHQQAGLKHAEINAIENCLDLSQLADSIVYVTLEPCCHTGKTGPCVVALIEAKIKTVVIAMLDPNPLVMGQGVKLLKQAGIEVILGVCEQSAQELNSGFLSRMIKKRPYIRSKIAASLDGCVALNNGQSKWITNDLCRQDVHLIRAYSDAIVTTSSTVLADDPQLTARDLSINSKVRKYRVVIDNNLKTNPAAKIYQNQDIAKTIVICNPDMANNSNKIQAFEQLNIKIYFIDCYHNLPNVWTLLADLGCNDILIEAGGRFNGYLLANNNKLALVDEWIIYQSGLIMGSKAQSMFNMTEYNFDSISSLFKLKCEQIKQFDDNWRLVLKPEPVK